MNQKKIDDLHLVALLLSEVVVRTLDQLAEMQVSNKPILNKVPIVEFGKRMRVWSFDKFDGEHSVSTVNFYVTDKDKHFGKAVGAIVLYLKNEYTLKLFKALGYPEINIDDGEELSDATGTFVNLIAAKFKSGLIQVGFVEPIMSHFKDFEADMMEGVAFDHSQKEKYEISFEIEGEKCIVFDLTMGKLPKINE